MKTLLVGFKKYAAHKSNPAEEVLKLIKNKDVVSIALDASYDKVLSLSEIIAKEKPDYIITMNLSPFRKEPAIEEYAYNEMRSVQPDVDGNTKKGEPIVKDGPRSLNSVLDIPSIQNFLSSRGTSLAISIDPGFFVCNEASYLARLSGIPSVSLHLPEAKDFPLSEDAEIIEYLLEYFAAL